VSARSGARRRSSGDLLDEIGSDQAEALASFVVFQIEHGPTMHQRQPDDGQTGHRGNDKIREDRLAVAVPDELAPKGTREARCISLPKRGDTQY
jgi:hypothetical protein